MQLSWRLELAAQLPTAELAATAAVVVATVLLLLLPLLRAACCLFLVTCCLLVAGHAPSGAFQQNSLLLWPRLLAR